MVLWVSAQCRAAGQPGTLPPATVFAQWQERIRTQIENPRFQHAQWGILVVSLESGRALFEQNADRFFQPGSNTKLFTAALVLDRLGPDGRIRTPIRADDPPDTNGVIRGDVCIDGRGDPTWGSDWHDGDRYAALDPLTSVLARAGVRRIEGDLVGDTAFLGTLRYGRGWMWEDLEYVYGSPLSALSLEDNTLDLRVAPAAQAGEPCVVISHHPLLDQFSILNRSATTLDRSPEGLVTQRPLGTRQVILLGGLQLGTGAETVRVPVESPAELFVERLAVALQGRGITLDGCPRVGSSAAANHVLGYAESLPVRVMVRRMMKNSHNLTAALLFAHTGAQQGGLSGETAETAGMRALQGFLLESGLPASDVHVEEGSGLSRNNLVTPRALVALLVYMHQHAAAKDFLEALPVAGVDGSLERRLRATPAEGNLRAKTGTLRWAQALSGYMNSQAGEPLAFSILLNRHQPAEGNPSGTQEIDAVVLLINALSVCSRNL